ncbi:MAG TPA: RNA polymerase sigma factor [Bacteroidales bacterium]
MEFDPAFIKLLKAQDRKAQKTFYLQLAPKMYGVCLRYASDGDDAEDIMQEGFIRVFRHVKDFRGDGSLEGWVRRTMVNTAINFYRKRIKRGINTDLKYVKGKADDKVFVIEKLAAEEIIELVKKLPDGYRTVFNLNVIEGYTHKEIGEMLNISENTSKSQLSRARASLQKMIHSISKRENID